MFFVTNNSHSCFGCYCLHSGSEQVGNFPQVMAILHPPKRKAEDTVYFSHRKLTCIKSFLTRLDKINIPEFPNDRTRADSPTSPAGGVGRIDI